MCHLLGSTFIVISPEQWNWGWIIVLFYLGRFSGNDVVGVGVSMKKGRINHN